MRRLSYILIMLSLCLSFMGIAVGEGPDGRFVPGDLDGDRVVSDEEMDAVRESYKDGDV